MAGGLYLPPEEIRHLLPHISSRAFRQGTVLFHQGDPADDFYIVEHGKVDILDEQDGGRKIATLTDDEVVGEIALLTGEPRSAAAVAAEDTQTWVIARKDFTRIPNGRAQGR